MADKDSVIPNTVQSVLPAPQVGTHFTVVATNAEFLLMFGQSRPVLKAANQIGIAVEWTSTYSLGPVSAKQLAMSLTHAVSDWESKAKLIIPIENLKTDQAK